MMAPRKRAHVAKAVLLLAAILSGDHFSTAFVTPERRHSSKSIDSGKSSELHLFRNLERVKEANGETTSEANGSSRGYSKYQNGSDKVPFLVERLGERPRDEVFKGIAEMCIR